MQGSTVRRALDSFPPFRADEMVETGFSDRERGKLYTYYPTLGGRLRVAREKYPLLVIRTAIVLGELRQKAVVTCRATSDVVLPEGRWSRVGGHGIGTADKEGDGPRMLDSLIELAEARAISRALRSLGIGTEFVGAEEMTRAGALAEMSPVSVPHPDPAYAGGQRSTPTPPVNTNTGQVTTPAATVAPGKARRDATGKRLWEQCSGDNSRYVQVLGSIIPGRVSVNDLSEHELELVDLVVEHAVICESPAVVESAKRSLMDLIGAKTPVESWTAQHLLAARAKKRANGGVLPAPGHSAHGEHEPKF